MPFSVNLPTPCDAAGARTPLLRAFGTPFVSPFILNPFVEASGRRRACTKPAQGVLSKLRLQPLLLYRLYSRVTEAKIGDGALFVRSLIRS